MCLLGSMTISNVMKDTERKWYQKNTDLYFTLSGIVPKTHNFNTRENTFHWKQVHAQPLSKMKKQKFYYSLFFSVNSQREYTLEISFLLRELNVGSCLMCSASVWPRFRKTLKSVSDCSCGYLGMHLSTLLNWGLCYVICIHEVRHAG